MKDQSHPLYSVDRDNVDRLLAKDSPEDADVVDLARLLLRYEGFPGASDLQSDMAKIMKLWGFSRETLNAKARLVWNDGYVPGRKADEVVGSGFDTSDGVVS